MKNSQTIFLKPSNFYWNILLDKQSNFRTGGWMLVQFFREVISKVLPTLIFLLAFPSFAKSSEPPSKSTHIPDKKSAPVALVYNGPGSCAGKCATPFLQIVKAMGMKSRFVNPENLTREIFDDAVVWIHPGGTAYDAAIAMNDDQKRLVRNFVNRGGGYAGFCAGAFLAGTTTDDEDNEPQAAGFGFLNYSVPERTPGETSYLPISWDEFGERHVFFEDGPYFVTNKHSIDIAQYSDGSLAAITTWHGRGNVVLSGVHPEAPLSWGSEISLIDPDGKDTEVAAHLIWMALPDEVKRR
jgi:glutamine amidotransferase-like uncharacterized protein